MNRQTITVHTVKRRKNDRREAKRYDDWIIIKSC